MSRPAKFCRERAARVLEAIGAGATRKAVAGHAGIDETTLYRWLARYASFASELRACEDDVELRCCALILKAATDDWRASAWWLERRRSDEYGRRERLDVTVRQRAAEYAERLGLNPDELIAEAQRIIDGG